MKPALPQSHPPTQQGVFCPVCHKIHDTPELPDPTTEDHFKKKYPFSFCPACRALMVDYESGGRMKCPACNIEFMVVKTAP